MHAAMSSSFAAPNHLTPTLLIPPPSRHSQPHTSLKCDLPPPSSSSDHRDRPNSTLLKTLSTTTLALSSAATVIFFTTPLRSLLPNRSSHLSSLGGSGGNNNSGRGGGGNWFSGGAGDGSFWSRLFSPSPAIAEDNDSSLREWDSHGLPANIVVNPNWLSGFKKYKISDISFFDRGRGCPDDFFHKCNIFTVRPGGVYTKSQLKKELETLASCGFFQKVDMQGNTNPDGTISLSICFTEETWRQPEKFRCVNVGLIPPSDEPIELDPDATAKERLLYKRSLQREHKRRMEEARPCLLPTSVQAEITDMVKSHDRVSVRMMERIRNRVLEWYYNEGYTRAKVVHLRTPNKEELLCEVVEGDITQVSIQFFDKLGYVVEGNTQIPVVERQLPEQLRPGHPYHIEAAKQAVRNMNSLQLFERIDITPRPDEKNEEGTVVEIKLRELPPENSEVFTSWNIVPAGGGGGRFPTLLSLLPGGTVKFHRLNLKGLNRNIHGTVTTDNFLDPQDDFRFKFQYEHPYVDGVKNPRNRTLKVSCFNTRKLSPVFVGGPFMGQVPPTWVDRAGLKAKITEKFTPQSKFTYGLVMEEIITRDESKRICATGKRFTVTGQVRADGPPTTLSGTGIDWMTFLQANITRDNTKFVNGAVVGKRIVFRVDQGLGIGRNFPFFNRHHFTLTEFLQLKSVEEGAGKPPPPVLVLHGHYGGCVGDLPNYEAFTLGGPYSIRGYNMGEIGAARRILELAAEIRIPVKGTHAYAFVEHGTDLGSSKDVTGNPSRFYRRLGHGSSYGFGLKLGRVRAEYAVDRNLGTGAAFLRFGERFCGGIPICNELVS